MSVLSGLFPWTVFWALIQNWLRAGSIVMFLGFLFHSCQLFGLVCLGLFPGRGKLGLARCPGPWHAAPETRGGSWALPPQITRQTSLTQIEAFFRGLSASGSTLEVSC